MASLFRDDELPIGYFHCLEFVSTCWALLAKHLQEAIFIHHVFVVLKCRPETQEYKQSDPS